MKSTWSPSRPMAENSPVFHRPSASRSSIALTLSQPSQLTSKANTQYLLKLQYPHLFPRKHRPKRATRTPSPLSTIISDSELYSDGSYSPESTSGGPLLHLSHGAESYSSDGSSASSDVCGNFRAIFARSLRNTIKTISEDAHRRRDLERYLRQLEERQSAMRFTPQVIAALEALSEGHDTTENRDTLQAFFFNDDPTLLDVDQSLIMEASIRALQEDRRRDAQSPILYLSTSDHFTAQPARGEKGSRNKSPATTEFERLLKSIIKRLVKDKEQQWEKETTLWRRVDEAHSELKEERALRRKEREQQWEKEMTLWRRVDEAHSELKEERALWRKEREEERAAWRKEKEKLEASLDEAKAEWKVEKSELRAEKSELRAEKSELRAEKASLVMQLEQEKAARQTETAKWKQEKAQLYADLTAARSASQ